MAERAAEPEEVGDQIEGDHGYECQANSNGFISAHVAAKHASIGGGEEQERFMLRRFCGLDYAFAGEDKRGEGGEVWRM